MKKQLSPASLVSITGAILAVTGLVSYFNDATNLSVPTFFYGVPILLIGLAMKNSEIGPTKILSTESDLSRLKRDGPKELSDLIADVTRFRYGQRVHLETSLQALKLWDDKKPPQLLEITLLEENKKFGVLMKFESQGVPLEKWEQQKDRLGRFFAKDLTAEIKSNNSGEINLELQPKTKTIQQTSTNPSE